MTQEIDINIEKMGPILKKREAQAATNETITQFGDIKNIEKMGP